MQNVALDQGWDKEKEENALFRTAIAFEPEYQYYYRAHAYFLLPKWHGEDGESQNFANKIAAEIGGAQGSIIYFEIAGDMLCDCGKDDETDGYSWNRIKEGYNAIQQNMGLRSIT